MKLDAQPSIMVLLTRKLLGSFWLLKDVVSGIKVGPIGCKGSSSSIDDYPNSDHEGCWSHYQFWVKSS